MQKPDKPGLKRRILAVAGRLFSLHGYDKTTYRMIADELGVVPSAIAYYFQNKTWLVRDLFIDCMNILREYVAANLTEGFNYFLFNGIVDIHFYRSVMQSDHIWAIFNHKNNEILFSDEWLSLFEHGLREVTDSFHKDFNDKELRAATIMNIGARTSIFREFSQHGTMTVDECCYYFVYLAGVLSRLDEATIQRNIRRAFEFADRHEFPPLPLFPPPPQNPE